MDSMNEIIRAFTDEIYRINKLLDYQVLSPEKIAEEEENFKLFLKTQEDIEKLLQEAQQCPLDNKELLIKYLAHLHFATSNLSWYFYNLHDHLRTVFQKYPFSKEFKERD